MKKNAEGLDALNAITDKVLAYKPPKKVSRRPKAIVVTAAGLSVARIKEAKERRGKLPKDEYFSPQRPITSLT